MKGRIRGYLNQEATNRRWRDHGASMGDDDLETGISSWEPVTFSKLFGFSAGLFFLCYLLKTDRDGFILLLDHANLAFHEAGHLIFGVFGPAPALYGGTLGQLVFPVTAMIAFWLRRETISFAAAGVWFFENFFNIARYMADARAQVLPLVGNGEHDWTRIFSRWGVLGSDTAIAGLVSALGWLGLVTVWLWVLRRWQIDR